MFSDFMIHSVGQAGGESGRQKDEFHVSVSLDIPASCKKIFSLPWSLTLLRFFTSVS